MKKRTLSLLLAIVLIVSLFSGCAGLDTLSLNSMGFRCIYTARDLKIAAKNPNENYILMNDVDMKDQKWTPIEGFSGIFDGNCKTISNLTVTTTAEGSVNMGMFGSVAEEGVVKFLHLKKIIINATETAAMNIGSIAGVVEGKLEQCSATGYIYDEREVDPDLIIGVLAGRVESGASVQAAASAYTIDDAGAYRTDGLAADMSLPIPYIEANGRSLVGFNAEGNPKVIGVWRDRSYGSHRLSEDIQQRQDKAEEIMRKAGTIEWTTPKTLTSTIDKLTMYFKPGYVYIGVPYAHTGGSYERAMYVMDTVDGVNQVTEWLAQDYSSGRWGAGDSLKNWGFTTYIGSDCSSAVTWGWYAISPARVKDIDGEYQGGMFPYLTNTLVPNKEDQETRGIYPVGEWTGATYSDELAAYDVTDCETTTDIINKNSDEVMYEAYALTRKADALLYADPGGHTRMSATDPIVIRDADGNINPELSYFVTNEQGGAGAIDETKGIYTTWRIHYRYTFKVMLKGSTLSTSAERMRESGNSQGYVPITIRALRDETVNPMEIYTYPAGQKTEEIVSPVQGVFGSNYRIQAGTVIIKDKSGKEVYNQQVFDCFEGNISYTRGAGLTYDLAHFHPYALDGLSSGDYTFTVIALMADGTYHTVVENQKFSI